MENSSVRAQSEMIAQFKSEQPCLSRQLVDIAKPSGQQGQQDLISGKVTNNCEVLSSAPKESHNSFCTAVSRFCFARRTFIGCLTRSFINRNKILLWFAVIHTHRSPLFTKFRAYPLGWVYFRSYLDKKSIDLNAMATFRLHLLPREPLTRGLRRVVIAGVLTCFPEE